MTVLDQLVFVAALHGVPRDEAAQRARHWLNRFRIGDAAGRRAEQLSKGNQQKVQFIGAILHDPDVLLLDEPFSGLDPINASLLKEAFLDCAIGARPSSSARTRWRRSRSCVTRSRSSTAAG